MARQAYLFGLIAITAVVGVPSLYCFVVGVSATIYDMLHSPPPNTYPTLPSLAPAFVVGSLVFLVPLAILWWTYFAVTRQHDKRK